MNQEAKRTIIKKVIEEYVLPQGINMETACIVHYAATLADDSTPLLEVGRFFAQYGVYFQDFNQIAEKILGERPVYRE